MSSITGSCSESAAQTLFNQRIQELQQARHNKLEQPSEKDPLELPGSFEDSSTDSSQAQSSITSRKATEPGKGEFLDLYA